MKYAIIENEEVARQNLLLIMKRIRPKAECVFMADSVGQSVNYFSKKRDVDIIFMDIELDDSSCFDIFRQCEVTCPVIFATAYDEYALQAFKNNGIDYLLKPYGDDDVLSAIEKYEHLTSEQHDYSKIAQAINNLNKRSRILINTGDSFMHIRAEDIAWVEAGDKYISIIHHNGSSILTDFSSLGEISDLLDPNEFYQVSRSVITSADAIIKVSKYFKGRLLVKLKAGSSERNETMSAARKEGFLSWYGQLK